MAFDKETSEAVQRVLNGTSAYAGIYRGTHFCVCWGEPGVGWGEFHFKVKEETDTVQLYSESMSKEFVKKMLCRLVDDAEIAD